MGFGIVWTLRGEGWFESLSRVALLLFFRNVSIGNGDFKNKTLGKIPNSTHPKEPKSTQFSSEFSRKEIGIIIPKLMTSFIYQIIV